MNQRDMRMRPSEFIFSQSAWYSAIDRSMMMLGSAQRVDAAYLVEAQNSAIRDCWRVTGDFIRKAMFELSEAKGIYPEELKDDRKCRMMLTNKNDLR